MFLCVCVCVCVRKHTRTHAFTHVRTHTPMHARNTTRSLYVQVTALVVQVAVAEVSCASSLMHLPFLPRLLHVHISVYEIVYVCTYGRLLTDRDRDSDSRDRDIHTDTYTDTDTDTEL